MKWTDFVDENGDPRRFTWRTISTWLYRYKLDGVTTMVNKKRSDAGKTRKVSPEQLLEAINQVLPLFREKGRWDKSDLFKACLEKGLLSRTAIAPTTFYRFIRQYDRPDRMNERYLTCFTYGFCFYDTLIHFHDSNAAIRYHHACQSIQAQNDHP